MPYCLMGAMQTCQRGLDETFTLATDASDVGLTSVLSTANGTIVEYARQILTKAEKKLCTVEKECLAILPKS